MLFSFLYSIYGTIGGVVVDDDDGDSGGLCDDNAGNTIFNANCINPRTSPS